MYKRQSRDLVALLGVSSETKEGKLGLLVCHVYRNSPAEKLGIRPGDILLSVRKAGDDHPIEFFTSEVGSERYYGGRFFGGSSFDMWRSRRNFITWVLTKIGPGQKVILTYLHKEKDKYTRCCREIVLEEGPEDFESTERKKIGLLGIVVRNLTYEVRDALKLPEDFPGVIISSVERGSKADIHRLSAYQIITHVNNEPVRSVGHFEKVVRSAVKGREKKIYLRVWTIGESSIISIDLSRPSGSE